VQGVGGNEGAEGGDGRKRAKAAAQVGLIVFFLVAVFVRLSGPPKITMMLVSLGQGHACCIETGRTGPMRGTGQAGVQGSGGNEGEEGDGRKRAKAAAQVGPLLSVPLFVSLLDQVARLSGTT
jgi:hypothetical protein